MAWIPPYVAQVPAATTAQAFGATYQNRRLGTGALATATSFFPAKPLGCYGDGGAVMTDDGDLFEAMRSLRVHGEGRDKYDCARIGLCGRLDTIQAAVLIEKLKIFPEEIAARERIARRYGERLADVATVPRLRDDATSVWAQYTIRLASGRRDGVATALKAHGMGVKFAGLDVEQLMALNEYFASLTSTMDHDEA